MYDAGRLNERFAFDSRGPASGPDDGTTQGDFVERFDLAAERLFLRGGEAVMAGRLQGKQPVIIRVRASSLSRQITTEWQARDKRSGEPYAIHGVTITPDRDWIEILAESGVAS